MVTRVVVRGTQRIEPATVLSYMAIREGQPYDEQIVDLSLKTLFATGLFADVKMGWDGSTLTVNVVENPIINQIVFEGNSKVSEKDLVKEVQLKPREVFTRAKVQADVQRIIELYRRNGKFAATVDPQIIQRPQNRVDLIFSINEGPTTGVARISFIGNHVFDDDTLREQIATEESDWWKFLSSNDNYDPDRLTFDREQIRRFYLKRGYADFRVVSAVAELTPDRRNFYITFTVDEGDIYKFGKVKIESKIKELDTATLRSDGADPRRANLRRRTDRQFHRRAHQCGRHQGLCLRRGASAHRARPRHAHHRRHLQCRSGPARLCREDQHHRQHAHAGQSHPPRVPAGGRRCLQSRAGGPLAEPASRRWASSRMSRSRPRRAASPTARC